MRFTLCNAEQPLQGMESKKKNHKKFNPLTTHHIETSQLICSANQLTGFFIMGTLVVTGLKDMIKRKAWLSKHGGNNKIDTIKVRKFLKMGNIEARALAGFFRHVKESTKWVLSSKRHLLHQYKLQKKKTLGFPT